MEKKTVFSRLEVYEGSLSLKLILDEGQGFGQIHRITFVPDIPPQVMFDAANQELVRQGFPKIAEDIVERALKVINATLV